jgi:hypothetical protein
MLRLLHFVSLRWKLGNEQQRRSACFSNLCNNLLSWITKAVSVELINHGTCLYMISQLNEIDMNFISGDDENVFSSLNCKISKVVINWNKLLNFTMLNITTLQSTFTNQDLRCSYNLLIVDSYFWFPSVLCCKDPINGLIYH